MADGILVNEGTQTRVAGFQNGTIQYPIVKLDAGVGSAVLDWGGTIPTVAKLTSGSVVVTSGTVGSVAAVAVVHNAGTLQAGTVQLNPAPTITPLIQGTLGTAGGSFFGTLSAASGAGTKHYISGLQVVVQSGTPDVRILTGTAIQGTGFIAGGAFPPGGGIARDLTLPFATGTNSEITYHFVGAGTALIGVSYWKGA